MTIRNLDNAIYERLKNRARLHHRSVEAEARSILDGELRVDRSELAAEAKAFRERLRGRYAGDVLAEIRADRER